MMKKKDYRKPAMKVVELQHRSQLLSGSMKAQRSGYDRKRSDGGTGTDEEVWE